MIARFNLLVVALLCTIAQHILAASLFEPRYDTTTRRGYVGTTAPRNNPYDRPRTTKGLSGHLVFDRPTTRRVPVIGVEACNRTHLASIIAEVMRDVVRGFRSDMTALRDVVVLDEDMPGAVGGDIKLATSGIQQQIATVKQQIFVARSQDCNSVYDAGVRAEGAYNLNPRDTGVFSVWCRAGWTVVQRRSNGAVNFNLPWANYVAGFGAANQDHWLGLQRLYLLTNPNVRTLRFELLPDLRYGTGHTVYWSEHTNFRVNAANGYNAYVGVATGNHGQQNRLTQNINGYMFSTYDRDQDGVYRNCAVDHKAGWWYARLYSPFRCTNVNINGKWTGCTGGNNVCAYWYPWLLRSTLMLIK